MALKVIRPGSGAEEDLVEEVMTLDEAAERLGRSRGTLVNQIRVGVFQATKSGNIYLTTASEVERYRRENLGQRGPRSRRRDIDTA